MDAGILFEIKTDKELKKKKRGRSHALMRKRKLFFDFSLLMLGVLD
ncbi:hypothetical protein GW12_27160 [Acinetobacter sp. HR7]|nr:hypothetical protein GW12_27160 [Acinetobacter sp. HR7]